MELLIVVVYSENFNMVVWFLRTHICWWNYNVCICYCPILLVSTIFQLTPILCMMQMLLDIYKHMSFDLPTNTMEYMEIVVSGETAT